MPDPIRALVLAEKMFLALFLALKVFFYAKISKMLDFWLWDDYEKWFFFEKNFFHEKMIFYFIVLNVSKIVSEHYRHPRIPSRSLKNMQDNHKGTESRLKWVKSIKLRTDFVCFFCFFKKMFFEWKIDFSFYCSKCI